MAKPFQYDEFLRKLDETHTWPCDFVFKFILKPQHISTFKELFPDDTFTTRESRKGNYVSITLTRSVESSSEVKAIYQKAREIPDVILL